MAIVRIFQDTHFWDSNLRNRIAYVGESKTLAEYILNTVKEDRTSHPKEKYYVFFAGDTFHRDSKSSEASSWWTQYFLELRSNCNGLFFTVGNHELTYPKENIFWSLVNKIESQSLIASSSNYARGRMPIGRIVDSVDIEGVEFHTVHYGTIAGKMSEGKRIAIVHDSYLAPALISSMEKLNQVDLKTEYTGYHEITDSSYLSLFDEVFLGHMHLATGNYTIEFDGGFTTGLHYMGTLGSTNKEEVRLVDPNREIPLIIIKDGEYTVKNTIIKLPKHKDVLDEKSVKKTEEAYERVKERKQIKQTRLNGDDPIKKLERILERDGRALEIFQSSIREELPKWISIHL